MVSDFSVDSVDKNDLDGFIEDIEKGKNVLELNCNSNKSYLFSFAAQLGKGKGIGTALWLDGMNSFDPYLFSRYARKFGMKPNEALNNVYISRAFTYYQIASLIIEKMWQAIENFHPSLVIITGLMSLYNRSNTRRKKNFDFIGPILEELEKFRERKESILITDTQKVDEMDLLSTLESLSDIVISESNSETSFVDSKTSRAVTLEDFARGG